MTRPLDSRSTRPLVLKLGGELIETADQRRRLAVVARALAAARPLVIVHGGGRAIDAELARRQIAPRKVDGLRITDDDTLDAVVAVLAGSANTDLVASLVAAGVVGVGLTGVDAGFGVATRAAAHQTTSGAVVDLGRVGDPADIDPALVLLLSRHGYVPVIASLGIEAAPASRILNVNADVMACRLAAALGGCDLVIAGATPGVLDRDSRTIDELDAPGIDALIAGGTATAGMIAKLDACRMALANGVAMIRLIDGRALESGSPAKDGEIDAPGTTLRLVNDHAHSLSH